MEAKSIKACLLSGLLVMLSMSLATEVAKADFTFGTPTNLGPIVSDPSVNTSPSISADGLELYFSSDRSGGYGGTDIWVTTRATTEDDWGEPVNIGPVVNSAAAENNASISADGLALYFCDWGDPRPGGLGETDIWVTTRPTKNDEWGEPVNLGPTVNSSAYEATPEISSDGLELYFESDRPGGYGLDDIYVTTRATTEDDWGTPVNLGPTINSSLWEHCPSISADGLTLFFDLDIPGDLMVTRRATKDDDWGEPVNLGHSASDHFASDISADGSTLYFMSDRPGGYGILDLWQVPILSELTEVGKADFTFGTPTNLGPIVNGASVNTSPSISADGLELYFSSDRSGGYGGTDIWVTTRATTEDDWGEPVNIGPVVNSAAAENNASISADGLALYFCDWGDPRPGGLGETDIWVTTRPTKNDEWGEPVNLGPTVNSSAYEATPEISSDGLELYFESDRPGGYGLDDIYVTTRATTEDDWGTPVNLGPTINSSLWEHCPSISADGLTLFFDLDIPGDLMVTRRATKDDDWGEPVNLGHSASDHFASDISADGSTLYFMSDRPGGYGILDLWQVPILPELYDNVFFMSLSPGLNMISLPLEPIEPYTARSFAEEMGATVVIRYDTTLGRFVGFAPAASGDGFPLNGGEGYIVNVPAGGTVAFTGAAWTNEPPVSAAPPAQANTAWAFVVSGSVLDGDMMSAEDGGYTLTVKNLRTGATATEIVDTSGYSAAVWADLSRKAVIEAGDEVEIAVIDSSAKLASGPFVHEVTLDEIRNAVLDVRLRLGQIIPEKSALLQNYPNPFNPETWIPYHLKDATPVSIRIYNVTGGLIRTLDLGNRDAGVHVSRSKAAYWDGKNQAGEEIASGIYFYSITADDGFSATRKMVIKK